MFRKRSTEQQTELNHADGDGTLILQTTASPESSYQFPSEVVQAHRQMISRLIHDDGLGGRLSVVSALRGEGVTYSSLAMATTLGHDFSKRVCYVDLNWWWPSREVTGLIQQSPGIAGILKNDKDPGTVLIGTRFPNLFLLPAGQLLPAERHVIARSSSLKNLLEQLNEEFDVMILDVPAILASSDAISLASLGDTCCIVVRQGASSATLVKQALDEVTHMDVKGVLLNRMRISTPKWVRNMVPAF